MKAVVEYGQLLHFVIVFKGLSHFSHFFIEPVKIHPGDRIGDAAEGEIPVEENGSEIHTENHSLNSAEHDETFHRRTQPRHHQNTMHLNNAEDHNTAANQTSSLLANLLSNNETIKEETVVVDNSEFNKIRQILCAVLGVLTRLSFLCSFGTEYVQVSEICLYAQCNLLIEATY